jgi:hypothetical protein
VTRGRQGHLPNGKLVNALKAWTSGAIASVEQLVQSELAPAVALTFLGEAVLHGVPSD